MFNLKGKTVLVTGGSRGIGAATARAIAGAGGDVLIHYARNEAAARAVAHELGPRCRGLASADLAQEDGAAVLWEAAIAKAGRIDVLVNNAGNYDSAPLDMPLLDWRKIWQRTLQIQLIAVAELCRSAIGHFREHGGGRIINVASRSAFRGDPPDMAPYGASKSAVVTLTKTIARGYARENILCFCIAPSYVATESLTAAFDDEAKQRLAADNPLGDLATPEECGALAAFLCTDEVRHMTGATFDINGASHVR